MSFELSFLALYNELNARGSSVVFLEKEESIELFSDIVEAVESIAELLSVDDACFETAIEVLLDGMFEIVPVFFAESSSCVCERLAVFGVNAVAAEASIIASEAGRSVRRMIKINNKITNIIARIMNKSVRKTELPVLKSIPSEKAVTFI